jgi:hypothetical protein
MTNVNPVHNAPRLSVTGPGVQVDRARRGGWGRERSITNRPGLALPDFDRPGPTWGVGEGEVCYRQTQPDTPGFRPTRPGVGGGGGRGLLQTDPARHSRISTWPGPALPDFDRPGPDMGGGGGRGLLQTDPAWFFAHYFTGLSLPPPPKTSVADIKTYWINIYQLHREQAVTGRIFQALPTQTDTTVALIYKISKV